MHNRTFRLNSSCQCSVGGIPQKVILLSQRSWVLLFFLGQLAGSLGVLWLLKIRVQEMMAPLGLLALGAASSLLLSGGEEKSVSNRRPWVPALVYAAFIFSLSQRSFSGVTVSVGTDVFHPVEFASLGLLLCLAWHPVCRGNSFGSFAWRVMVTGMLFAVSDEVHQAFVPGRSPSALDLVLDLAGLSAAVGAFRLASYVRRISRGNS